jgi:dienelactone hydrolase
MHFNIMPRLAALLLIFLCTLLSAGEEQWVVTAGDMEVPFHSWQAEGTGASTGVLVLVPCFNGDGAQMLDARWKVFAEKNHLVLLAPSFRAKGDENNRGKGYYYPEQGSGEVLEKALRELKRRTGADTDQVLMFGFSAGAHFSHRFALWKPQRVKAFVAYSAGWWSEPSAELAQVPALILCGEADERYSATYDFFWKGHKLGCPWLWRSYPNTGHALTPAVRDMAEVFLAHYAQTKPPASDERLCGDFQTYQSVPFAERNEIAEEFRLILPSKAVAAVWEREGK